MKIYKKETRKAQETAWRKLCANVMQTEVASRFRKEPIVPGISPVCPADFLK